MPGAGRRRVHRVRRAPRRAIVLAERGIRICIGLSICVGMPSPVGVATRVTRGVDALVDTRIAN